MSEETKTTNNDMIVLADEIETLPINTSIDLNDVEPAVDDENEDYGDLVDSNNKRAFELFNMKSKMNDIKRIADDIQEKTKSVIDNEDELSVFDEIALKFDDGEIEKLTDEAIEEIYNNNGNPIELNFEFENPEDTKAFKRDFLEFRRQSILTTRTLNEEMEKMNKIFEESQAELDEIVERYGNMDNLIRTTLEDRLEEADTEEKKNLIKKLINNFDYALSLDNIKDFVNSYKGRSIIGYYRDEKKSQYIYKGYRKMCNVYKIKTDLAKFGGLEEQVIGEEYNKRPNIFLFTIMYYISTFANKEVDRTIGLFLTQLTINLKNLIYNKFEDETTKETFSNNIKSVIEMIG